MHIIRDQSRHYINLFSSFYGDYYIDAELRIILDEILLVLHSDFGTYGLSMTPPSPFIALLEGKSP